VAIRWSHGASAVRVETEAKKHVILPICWTDLVPRFWLAEHAGRTVHLDLEAVHGLARWVEARVAANGGRKLGHFSKCMDSPGPDGEQHRSDARTGDVGATAASAGSRDRAHPSAAAMVEQTCAPDAARRGRGEKRKRGSR
jgi:hypothetical protein